jgi:Family of unknown function (DUF6356)
MSRHLTEKNNSYKSHFRFAWGAGFILIIAGIASIIHAVFPEIFVSYSEQKVKALLRLSKQRNDRNNKFHY